MDEVNDEVDDSLEDYSEIIIIRALAGEELPYVHGLPNDIEGGRNVCGLAHFNFSGVCPF